MEKGLLVCTDVTDLIVLRRLGALWVCCCCSRLLSAAPSPLAFRNHFLMWPSTSLLEHADVALLLFKASGWNHTEPHKWGRL